MKLLGIDVCTGFCSVGIVDGEQVLAQFHEQMTRGHAERLAPMVAEALAAAELSANDLDGIAVTTGPGSFTGARLGVSFARGLALAAEVPAIGISVFETMAEIFDGEQVAVTLSGKNGSVLVQCFEGAKPVTEPLELPLETAWQILPASGEVEGIGSDMDTLLKFAPDEVKARSDYIHCDPVTGVAVAQIGARRLKDQTAKPPVPLYLRAPDAKPQAAVSL